MVNKLNDENENKSKSKYDVRWKDFIVVSLVLVGLLFAIFNYKLGGHTIFYANIIPASGEIVVKDISLCYDYKDILIRENCLYRESFCETDNCSYDKAVKLLDRTFCEDISDVTNNELRTDCLVIVLYNTVPEEAILDDDITICKGLEPFSEHVSDCEDSYYFVKADTLKDLSFCEKIVSEVSKNECLR